MTFPVMEMSWNLKVLKNIKENERKPGKMRIYFIVDIVFSVLGVAE